jgi:hypothetical protein
MLALGSKDVAYNILAGVYVRKSIEAGGCIDVDHVSGKLVEIGTVSSTIETETGPVLVPNRRLLESTTRILKAAD